MTTKVLEIDGAPTRRLHSEGVCRSPARIPLGSAALLYGMSLAVALPPAAWLPPVHGGVPMVHPATGLGFDVATMAATVGAPVTEVGRGRIALGGVDRRLHGLSLALDLFRVEVGRGVLVPIGVIRSEPATHWGGGSTPSALWRLALAAIPWYGRVRGCPSNMDADSILVLYGDATAQVAWLAADELATVSVTSLDGDQKLATEMVLTLSRLLASRLESRAVGR